MHMLRFCLIVGALAPVGPTEAQVTLRSLAQGRVAGNFTSLAPQDTGVDLVYQFPQDAPFALMTDQYSGNGVCVGDVDGDDLPDIFLTHYDHGNRLYRNLGNWKFEDITVAAGLHEPGVWCAGPSFVDIDGDGDLDVHVCVFDGPNRLYQNDGKGRFQDIAKRCGLAYQGPSVMMAFADYDLDGDLDGYLVTHRMPLGPEALPPRNSKEAFDREIIRAETRNGKQQAVIQDPYKDLFAIMEKGGGRIELITAGREDILYQNDGDGRFRDVSQAAGIAGRDIGLAATWWDANGDGYPDLYVSNDYKGPDHFYLNQRDGTFQDVTRTALPHIPWLSMGSDFSDINRDGRMDFLATDMAATTHYQQKVSMGDMDKDTWFLDGSDPRQMMRNAVYVNTGTARFVEAAFLTGLAASDWTWSPKFADFDNDGWEDLYITNGMSRDFMNSDLAAKIPSRWRSDAWRDTPVLRQTNLALRHTGKLAFENMSETWGLDKPTASYGAATADFDRDGDLDLVVVNYDEPVSLFRNDLNDQHRLLISLRQPSGNRFGIGAEVRLETEGGVQVKQLALARGFLSANEPVLHFGLGSDTQIKRLVVRWPGNEEEAFDGVQANTHAVLTRHQSTPRRSDPASSPFYRRGQWPRLPEPHRETPFNDYARQPLLPMKHSHMGPGLAVGDVNGDGNDDFFMGGAAGQSGQLVILSGAIQIITQPFEAHAASEDMGALFFDADDDTDLDLLVISGGVEPTPLADRLYLNDGAGGFQHSHSHLPNQAVSGSSVAAADVDRDGDLDLFIGTRLVPGRYPESAPSQLLTQENDHFTDRGHTLGTGMVTSALWTDLNGDGWQDLLVAEDWGPVRCWLNQKGTLTDHTDASGLSQWTGWWRGLASRDLDGDGDLDFVATNLGWNTKYKASTNHPLHLYYGDVDGTGKPHLIEAGYEADTLYPKRGKSCSTRAMPGLAERFATYHDFASATLTEIYGTQLENATMKSVNTLASGAFLNDGRGHFRFVPFPRLAQASQGFGIVLTEVNGDTFPDVYFVQNNFHPQPETGRFDSGLSQLLLGQGDGTFVSVDAVDSGLLVPGDATALAILDWNRDGGPDFLIAQNAGIPLTFQHQRGTTRLVRLQGSQVVGARLTLTLVDGRSQTAQLACGTGYLSQSTQGVFFGLPSGAEIRSLLVQWPEGGQTEIRPDAKERVWTVSR